MTLAPHSTEVHDMVDRLSPAQVEALYVILRGMLGGAGAQAEPAGEPDVTAPAGSARKHRFSFVGIMDGEPDLAARSAQILREELGSPPS